MKGPKERLDSIVRGRQEAKLSAKEADEAQERGKREAREAQKRELHAAIARNKARRDTALQMIFQELVRFKNEAADSVRAKVQPARYFPNIPEVRVRLGKRSWWHSLSHGFGVKWLEGDDLSSYRFVIVRLEEKKFVSGRDFKFRNPSRESLTADEVVEYTVQVAADVLAPVEVAATTPAVVTPPRSYPPRNSSASGETLAAIYQGGYWIVGVVSYIGLVIYGFATYGLIGGLIVIVLGWILAAVIAALWPLWVVLGALGLIWLFSLH